MVVGHLGNYLAHLGELASPNGEFLEKVLEIVLVLEMNKAIQDSSKIRKWFLRCFTSP